MSLGAMAPEASVYLLKSYQQADTSCALYRGCCDSSAATQHLHLTHRHMSMVSPVYGTLGHSDIKISKNDFIVMASTDISNPLC